MARFDFSDHFVAKWRGYLTLFSLANSFLVLILLAAGTGKVNGYTASSVGFSFFCAVGTLLWTGIIIGYLFKPQLFDFAAVLATHPYVDLAATLVWTVFWLAAFAALAADTSSSGCGSLDFCRIYRASAAFQFFEFAAFAALFVLITRKFLMNRSAGASRAAAQQHAPHSEVKVEEGIAPPSQQQQQQQQQPEPYYEQPSYAMPPAPAPTAAPEGAYQQQAPQQYQSPPPPPPPMDTAKY